jgi:hypothetical protein
MARLCALVLLVVTAWPMWTSRDVADAQEPPRSTQAKADLLHRRDELARVSEQCEQEGKLDEAIAFAMEALAIERSVHGDTRQEVANTVSSVSDLYFRDARPGWPKWLAAKVAWSAASFPSCRRPFGGGQPVESG